MGMERISVGVIGCGKQAEKHVPALQALGADVTSVDLDPLVGADFATRFNTSNGTSIDQLMTDPTIAAVDICTPTSSHHQLAMQAMSAGKPFFVEKPLCSSVEEAEEICARSESTGVPGAVGFIYRFAPSIVALRDHVKRADLGDLTMASFRIGGAGNHQLWKHQRASDGGAINEMLVHMLDLAVWFFGPIVDLDVVRKEQVMAERSIGGEMHSVDAEDFVLVIARCETGPELILQADFLSKPFRQHIELLGTNGSARASIVPNFGSQIVLSEASGELPAGVTSLDHDPANLHELQLADLLSAVSDPSHVPRCPVSDSRHIMAIVDQVHAIA